MRKILREMNSKDIVDIINKVNNYWQNNNPNHGNAFWHNAAYHIGNLAAFEVTGDEAYKDFSKAWAKHNEWKGAKSDNREDWKYSYGESDDYVLFGDWQLCFQVFIDFYNMDAESDDGKIARAKEVMEYQMSTPQNDYWWWADGLFMVMPVMTKLYNITGDNLYLEKLYEYFHFAKELMYDEAESLFYRDGENLYPSHKTRNGKKNFWARGNGWVFAGLARVLQDLPENDFHRSEYESIYKKMAKSIANCQQDEGYWTRSLLDPSHINGYETSGTSFFLYGYLWGINNGFLERSDYEPLVEKAWNYLSEIALQENGKVGYIQPIGENADKPNISSETTADFGVGVFLLAASELVRYLN